MNVVLTFVYILRTVCASVNTSILQMTLVAFKSQSSQSAVASDLVNGIENRDYNTQEGNEGDCCLDRLPWSRAA